jgi:hypothetical protein
MRQRRRLRLAVSSRDPSGRAAASAGRDGAADEDEVLSCWTLKAASVLVAVSFWIKL